VVTGEPGGAGRDGEQPQRGDVDGGDVGHVDDDVVVEALEALVDRVADLPGAADVEVAVQHQDVTVRDDVHPVLLTGVPRRHQQ
jgi:hypothetical protein